MRVKSSQSNEMRLEEKILKNSYEADENRLKHEGEIELL